MICLTVNRFLPATQSEQIGKNNNLYEHAYEEWKSRVYNIAKRKQKKTFWWMIWEHMRASLLLLRTSRFDLDFIRGWKMMEMVRFSPASIADKTSVWHKTRNVLLSFSVIKKYVSKCDSSTMTYLFCILDLYLPCCTPFFTSVPCVLFQLAYLLSCFHCIWDAGATIKSKSEKKNEWIGICRAYAIIRFGLNIFSTAVIIITVDLMVCVCALLPLLLCQRYSQRRCGCCHFGWWWWNEDFWFHIHSLCGRGSTIMMYFLCFLNGFSTMLLFDYDYG